MAYAGSCSEPFVVGIDADVDVDSGTGVGVDSGVEIDIDSGVDSVVGVGTAQQPALLALPDHY